MTPLDWYILFAIAFAVFALWVVDQAEAARRRLRQRVKDDGDSCEEGSER